MRFRSRTMCRFRSLLEYLITRGSPSWAHLASVHFYDATSVINVSLYRLLIERRRSRATAKVTIVKLFILCVITEYITRNFGVSDCKQYLFTQNKYLKSDSTNNVNRKPTLLWLMPDVVKNRGLLKTKVFYNLYFSFVICILSYNEN